LSCHFEFVSANRREPLWYAELKQFNPRRRPVATISEVASAAGVSLGTVSNYLNHPHKLADETRERVARAVDELGWVPRMGFRNREREQSGLIGLVLSDLVNPFYADVARGVEAAAAQAGYSVILSDTGGDATVEDERLRLLAEQRVAGVLITPAGGLPDQHYLELFARQGTHVVLLAQPRKREVAALPWVYVDDVAGGRLAGEHLLGLGHRRICFVHRTTNPKQQTSERLEGLRSALRRHGVDAREAVIELDSEGGIEDAERVARTWAELSPRPTAIFAANDLLAFGLLSSLHGMGIGVPEEVSVVGYDDLELSRFVVPSLTTVAQPRGELGRTAVELLLEEVGDRRAAHREVVFMPVLQVRSSSGPARGTTRF
jgi:LacI family transcriptional regulator